MATSSNLVPFGHFLIDLNQHVERPCEFGNIFPQSTWTAITVDYPLQDCFVDCFEFEPTESNDLEAVRNGAALLQKLSDVVTGLKNNRNNSQSKALIAPLLAFYDFSTPEAQRETLNKYKLTADSFEPGLFVSGKKVFCVYADSAGVIKAQGRAARRNAAAALNVTAVRNDTSSGEDEGCYEVRPLRSFYLASPERVKELGITEQRMRPLFQQLIDIVAACHAAGFLIRGIGGSNLMLRWRTKQQEQEQGEDRIILYPQAERTAPFAAPGSIGVPSANRMLNPVGPSYFPPEWLHPGEDDAAKEARAALSPEKRNQLTEAESTWLLGILLFEMLCRRNPFVKLSGGNFLSAIGT